MPAFAPDVQEPLFEFPAQLAGDIDAPHLVALGINVLMPPVNVLDLKCNQLADPHPGCRYQAHNEIVGELLVFNQLPFQIFIVGLADDFVQIRLLLYLNHGNGSDGCLPVFHETIKGTDPQVHGLGLIMLQEIDLVKLQVSWGELRIKMVELFHRIAVHTDCIRRFVVRGQILLKQVQRMVRL